MTVFGQIGDPVAGAAACLCEHHGAAYTQMLQNIDFATMDLGFDPIATDGIIVQKTITITKRCCMATIAAAIIRYPADFNDIEIERPSGTVRTTQHNNVPNGDLNLTHTGAWEVLDPGTYEYFLVNRGASTMNMFGSWIKIIASDCEG